MIRKAFLKVSIFTIISVFILAMLNPIFVIKIGHRAKLIEGVYNNTGDAYDVVLLGSSHMNSVINPNILWSDSGITSYNYGTGGQPFPVTYYLLEEIIKEHDFKVAVVDLYYLGLKEEYGSDSYIRYVLDNMKFSVTKVQAIMNCTPPKYWLSYFSPVFRYHDRWKELSSNDFNYVTDTYYYTKGFGAGSEVYGEDIRADLSIQEKADLPPKSEEYLYKMIELSKNEGFDLVFVNAPHDYTSTSGSSTWHENPAAMFNKVEEIAEENSIPFINYCNILDEIGFDFSSDMYNIGHVNKWGSDKVSIHFDDFLEENYDLVDHRNDLEYKEWELDLEKYMEGLTN